MKIDFDQWSHQAPPWIENQQYPNILASKVRVARNLQNYRFVSRASNEDLIEIIRKIRLELIEIELLNEVGMISMAALDVNEQLMLLDRRMVSTHFLENGKPREYAFSADESFGLMMNEFDHLRFQITEPGFQLEKTWQRIHEIETCFAKGLEFSYTDAWGYCTSRPEYVGTGTQLAVLAHFPALGFNHQIDLLYHSADQWGLKIQQMFHQDAGQNTGFYRISNRYTLSWSENELLKRLQGWVQYWLRQEADARTEILKRDKLKIQDQIARAIGVFSYAKLISMVELAELVSILRLGLDLNLIEGIDYGLLNALLILGQTSHLKQNAAKDADTGHIDHLRARKVQHKINFSSLIEKD